eukprot:178544_1
MLPSHSLVFFCNWYSFANYSSLDHTMLAGITLCDHLFRLITGDKSRFVWTTIKTFLIIHHGIRFVYLEGLCLVLNRGNHHYIPHQIITDSSDQNTAHRMTHAKHLGKIFRPQN